MRIEEFEEMIEDLLSDIAPNASVVVSEEGEVIIYTNLVEDHDGDLIELEVEDDEFMNGEDLDQLDKEEEEENDDE